MKQIWNLAINSFFRYRGINNVFKLVGMSGPWVTVQKLNEFGEVIHTYPNMQGADEVEEVKFLAIGELEEGNIFYFLDDPDRKTIIEITADEVHYQDHNFTDHCPKTKMVIVPVE